MKKEIKVYIEAYMQYQRIKPARHKPYGELGSLPSPTGPYTDISMDVITNVPLSKRRDNGNVTVLTQFHITCILLFVFIISYHVSYRPVCFLHVTTHKSLCTSLCFYLFLHHVTTPSKLLLLTSLLLFFFSSFLHASSCESPPPVPSHVT